MRRARDRSDERQVSIFLTAKGRGLKARMDCLPGTVGGMTGLDEAARRDLLGLLTSVRDELRGTVEGHGTVEGAADAS